MLVYVCKYTYVESSGNGTQNIFFLLCSVFVSHDKVSFYKINKSLQTVTSGRKLSWLKLLRKGYNRSCENVENFKLS